jgi:pyroglutamyl-peptidase
MSVNPKSAKPKIVLTGFGPFPGIMDNATATLIPRLTKAARALFPSHEVIGEVLPTEWRRAPEALRAIVAEGDVVLMLHVGVSESAPGFRLELIGRNMRTSLEDAAGELPSSISVIDQGPQLLASTIPAERIAARLFSLGLPCETSDNAGTYLCNSLLYNSLTAARALTPPAIAGFVHVPASLVGHGPDGRDTHPDCPLDWRMAVSGSLEIVASCLDHLAESDPPLIAG